MSNKVLIVAKAGTELSVTEEAFFKKHFGEDFEVVTPEQVKERGLTPEDFGVPKKEARPFPKDEPYLIERLPQLEMPEIITEKDISRGKKFYTDVLNKRSKKNRKK